VALPLIIPARVLAAEGQPGANERIGVGYIGVGRRGVQLMGPTKEVQLIGLPAAGRIVAVCDVNAPRADALAAARKCRAFYDYRKLLEAKDVDAVVVATPDHWHALPSIHACQAGKDVYTEKPLSLTVREAGPWSRRRASTKRVFQTGSQRRSMYYHRLGCQMVREGRIGKVHTIIAHNYPSPWECGLPGSPCPTD